MMKALVASVVFVGSALPAVSAFAKPPFEYHREFHRDARPSLVDRSADRSFDRGAARSEGGQHRDAARPTPFQSLNKEQKEKLCAQTGLCARTFHSDDVEDKTK